MDMEVGNNATTMLREAVDEIFEHETSIKAIDKDRRDLIKELKEQGCPVVVALGLLRADPLDAEQIMERKRASALTGRPVYVEAATFDPKDVGVSKMDVEEHGGSLVQINDLGAASTELRESIKELYATLKGSGFTVAVVKKIIRNKLNPKAQEKEDEADALLETYMRALA